MPIDFINYEHLIIQLISAIFDFNKSHPVFQIIRLMIIILILQLLSFLEQPGVTITQVFIFLVFKRLVSKYFIIKYILLHFRYSGHFILFDCLLPPQ